MAQTKWRLGLPECLETGAASTPGGFVAMTHPIPDDPADPRQGSQTAAARVGREARTGLSASLLNNYANMQPYAVRCLPGPLQGAPAPRRGRGPGRSWALPRSPKRIN